MLLRIDITYTSYSSTCYDVIRGVQYSGPAAEVKTAGVPAPAMSHRRPLRPERTVARFLCQFEEDALPLYLNPTAYIL